MFITLIATALTFLIVGAWLQKMYSVSRSSFLMSRQQRRIRHLESQIQYLEKQNANLRAFLSSEDPS